MLKVKYKVYESSYMIYKRLKELEYQPLLAFDIETRSIYTNKEVKEASTLLKEVKYLSREDLILCKTVADSSGLSHPKLSRITHIALSSNKEECDIFIPQNPKLLLNWLVGYKGKLLIWNSLFDLKHVHYHTGKFPIDYEDPMLLLKSLINDAQEYKARVGLKEFMGSYYDPKWSMYEEYNIENPKDKTFLDYIAIDGAATYYAWELLKDEL